MLEGQRRDGGAGRFVRAQPIQNEAMADVHAIKDADRQEKIGVGAIIVEAADDLHRQVGGLARPHCARAAKNSYLPPLRDVVPCIPLLTTSPLTVTLGTMPKLSRMFFPERPPVTVTILP